MVIRLGPSRPEFRNYHEREAARLHSLLETATTPALKAGCWGGPRSTWQEMDLFDLANCIRIGDPVEEIADFLCRPVSEVHAKIVELERSGELARRIAETAKGAKD